MASVIEQTLAVVMRCFVYRIPPAKTMAGHNAMDWFVVIASRSIRMLLALLLLFANYLVLSFDFDVKLGDSTTL